MLEKRSAVYCTVWCLTVYGWQSLLLWDRKLWIISRRRLNSTDIRRGAGSVAASVSTVVFTDCVVACQTGFEVVDSARLRGCIHTETHRTACKHTTTRIHTYTHAHTRSSVSALSALSTLHSTNTHTHTSHVDDAFVALGNWPQCNKHGYAIRCLEAPWGQRK